uniref:Uncharacterized protein n=1 Tax=Magnetococcus massalia (strain MO-1) TaxID=451514 RepID=A0A1S7LG49_MAGMO|nr:conserved protein of unknown function [Candidatus Magnetococcus massalia]
MPGEPTTCCTAAEALPEISDPLRQALLRLRHKTCVPSFLWQRLRGAAHDGQTLPLPLRAQVIRRMHPYLEILKQEALISEIIITPHPEKRSLQIIQIMGVSPRFQQLASRLFPS